MLSEGWYRENTPHFKASLEDGMIENMPANKDIRDDHLLFRKVKGVAKIPEQRTKSEDGNNKRHGDSGIAHLLCDYASTMPVGAIDWTPVPTIEEMSKDMFEDWGFGQMGGFV
jgi:phage FluMu gp28-like protein